MSFLVTAAEIEEADHAGITGTMTGVTFHDHAIPSFRALPAEHGLALVVVQDDPRVAKYDLTGKQS